MVKKYKFERIDMDFSKELREAMNVRLQKGLAKPKMEELSFREATHLVRRTDSWKNVLEELKTKPKRSNISIL